MIDMGTRGMTAPSNMILGSVTNRVLIARTVTTSSQFGGAKGENRVPPGELRES